MSLPAAAAVNPSQRIVAGLPFVEALARRMASSMPHSIDIGDLVQDGVIGLIDAANRFDADRGIKFETFAERRVRGAMIDALRKDAWPRGVRRQRRELEAARETLRAGTRVRAVAGGPGGQGRLGRKAVEPHDRAHQHHRIDLAPGQRRPHRRVDAAGGAAALGAGAPRRGVRTLPGAGPREGGHRVVALARAEGDRALLLRRSDDEADRARDWRQRIARQPVARARHPSPPRRARADDGAGAGRLAAQVDRAAVPAEARDDEGDHARRAPKRRAS